jgi:site-specific recombinase XerD
VASERLEAALDAFVRSKQKGTNSGNYQRNARRAIEEWIDWLANREEPIESFDQLQVSYMRQYARHLKERVDRDELAGSTANTYWNYIATFLGWCVYEELIAENPARRRRAEEELPDKRPRSDRQQFWSRADREALLKHLNERAHTAVDEQGLNAIKELRDRALASPLAYSGVRGAEVLRDRYSATPTTNGEAVSAGVTSISRPGRSSCSARARPTRKHLSHRRRAIRSNVFTKHSGQRVVIGRSFRPSTDRPSLASCARISLIPATMIPRFKKRSRSTTG